MHRRNSRLLGICLVAVLVVAGMGITTLADTQSSSFEDICVSGSGVDDLNGRYVYVYMYNGHPLYEQENTSYDIAIYNSSSTDHWFFYNPYGNFPFYNVADTYTPPFTGEWLIYGDDAPPGSTPPTLRACDRSESEPKPVVIVPTGDAGPEAFLDVSHPSVEGEDPAMAGAQLLAAIHTVGDVVTGSCRIIGASGTPTGASFVHVYVYSVDIVSSPEIVVLLDHWMASYNRPTQEFEFSWDTSELAPGYYDLRLFFQDGTAQIFRIQLTAEQHSEIHQVVSAGRQFAGRRSLSQQQPSLVAALQRSKTPTIDDYGASTSKDSISSRFGQAKVPKLSCEGYLTHNPRTDLLSPMSAYLVMVTTSDHAYQGTNVRFNLEGFLQKGIIPPILDVPQGAPLNIIAKRQPGKSLLRASRKSISV